jgi:hypothetical protein
MIEQTTTQEITPQEAAQILRDAHPVNVKQLSAHHIQAKVGAYAQLMREGWTQIPKGDPISFDRTGQLIDGYRRLAACVQAGVPFKSFVSKFVR